VKKIRKQIFIIHPPVPEIGDIRRLVVETVIESRNIPIALEKFTLKFETDIEVIYKTIEASDIIICDISHSAPDVMYQLGCAHALLKPVILLAQRAETIPFDAKGVQVVYYDIDPKHTTKFKDMLKKQLHHVLENPDEFSNRPKTVSSTNNIFISYCHKDTDFLNRLLVHLRPLEREGLIDLWVDSKIKAGDKWKTEIDNALRQARVAILLVSADFLSSDFIIDNELPPLLANAESKGTRIIPVIVKPCRFARDSNLADFQAVNDPSIPLVSLSEAERESVYDKISQAIELSIPSQKSLSANNANSVDAKSRASD